jgi:CubicO group peptidase (beta-lactamase class C family)
VTRPFDPSVLGVADTWQAGSVALAAIDRDGLVAVHGPIDSPRPWASVTKLLTGYVALVAVDRGLLALDEPAGPPGATVRHLLAHASGLAFDEPSVISPPGRTRIYSNTGFDVLAAVMETRTGRPFAALLREWILGPLGMSGTSLVGRPSQGLTGPIADLAAFALELLRPRVVPAAALAAATTVAFPGLRGVLPGVGRFDPLDWGLGFEIRDGKAPHWTGTRNSPLTFGHFGASGAFLWVDPVAGVAVACLPEREFGPWALAAWPKLSDAVLEAYGLRSLHGDFTPEAPAP